MVREDDGRMLYRVLGALAAIATPAINKARKERGATPLTYNVEDPQQTDISTRGLVQEYVLGNIKELIGKFEQNSGVVKKALGGRRSTLKERELVRSWQTHAFGDFFVVGYTDQGAALVQLGKTDPDRLVSSERFDTEDPRCFLVKGLAQPLAEVLEGLHGDPLRGGAVVVVRTTLVPIGDDITYFSTCTPANINDVPPQKLDASKQAALDAWRSSSRIYTSFNDQVTNVVPPSWWLRFENPYDMPGRTMARPEPGPLETSEKFMVTAMVWAPFADVTDPQFQKTMVATLRDPPESRVVMEGTKRIIGIQITLDDADVCRFCESGRPYGECCKKKVTTKIKKANKKGNPIRWVYDPVDSESYQTKFYGIPAALGFDTHFTISELQVSEVSVVLPNDDAVTEVASRLRTVPCFHATTTYKFDYLGWWNVPLVQTGIYTFGDLEIHPATRKITATALSARRAKILTAELKDICIGFDVCEPTIVSSVQHKQKPMDQDTLNDLATSLSAHATVESRQQSPVCSYCAKEIPLDDVKKCAVCRLVFYCSKTCQKSHWKTHKRICSTLAAQRQQPST